MQLTQAQSPASSSVEERAPTRQRAPSFRRPSPSRQPKSGARLGPDVAPFIRHPTRTVLSARPPETHPNHFAQRQRMMGFPSLKHDLVAAAGFVMLAAGPPVLAGTLLDAKVDASSPCQTPDLGQVPSIERVRSIPSREEGDHERRSIGTKGSPSDWLVWILAPDVDLRTALQATAARPTKRSPRHDSIHSSALRSPPPSQRQRRRATPRCPPTEAHQTSLSSLCAKPTQCTVSFAKQSRPLLRVLP